MSHFSDGYYAGFASPVRGSGYYPQPPLPPISQPVAIPPSRSYPNAQPHLERLTPRSDLDLVCVYENRYRAWVWRRLWHANWGMPGRLTGSDKADLLALLDEGWDMTDVAQSYGYPAYWNRREGRWDFRAVLSSRVSEWRQEQRRQSQMLHLAVRPGED